jgi:Ran GTPase-activating protein (RanGAP) involved in mRNA processing and transport
LPTKVSARYPNTPEEQYYDLQSHFMKMIEALTENINNHLNQIQENTIKEVEAFKEENRIKQAKEINDTVQDLKRKIESIKKTQVDVTMEMENLGKRTETGTTDASITTRTQEMEEKNLRDNDSIEEMDKLIKENAKCNIFLNQTPRIYGTLWKEQI